MYKFAKLFEVGESQLVVTKEWNEGVHQIVFRTVIDGEGLMLGANFGKEKEHHRQALLYLESLDQAQAEEVIDYATKAMKGELTGKESLIKDFYVH